MKREVIWSGLARTGLTLGEAQERKQPLKGGQREKRIDIYKAPTVCRALCEALFRNSH